MYYLVSGTGDEGSFDWVIEADSEESAKQDAQKDLSEEDTITSITALSVDDCIKREYDDLSCEVKRCYFENHYDMTTITVKEYAKIDRQFNKSPDSYYKAIKEFNKMFRLLRRLERSADIGKMKLQDLRAVLDSLSRARTEEEFNDILNGVKENYKRM